MAMMLMSPEERNDSAMLFAKDAQNLPPDEQLPEGADPMAGPLSASTKMMDAMGAGDPQQFHQALTEWMSMYAGADDAYTDAGMEE